MTIETFPQRAVKPPKTTPADIVRRASTPGQMMAHLRLAFPKLTMGEVKALVEAEHRRAKDELVVIEGETRAMEVIETLVMPVMRAHRDLTLGEALERLAGAGSEQATAALAQIDGPEARVMRGLLDKAVAADPYWEKTEDGAYRARAGATHQTPGELVVAYVFSRGDRIADDVSRDLLEYLARQELERQVEEDLERRVAAGELERVIGEDGEPQWCRRSPSDGETR